MQNLRSIAAALLLAAVSAICAGPAQAAEREVAFATPPPPRNEIVMENRVAVPMRDGVNLYADIYRPAGEGKWPVIVSRTPYSTERAPSAYTSALFFSRRGYAYVYQDVRGRHESDGKWEPFRNDIEDGYDTIEWAAKQPWSNGKVAMEGGSYLGHVQWRAAMSKPPHLVAIFPSVASTSLYHDWITLNGGWRLSFNFGWGPVRQESRIMQNTGHHTVAGGPAEISYDTILWYLPLNSMQKLAGRNAQFYKDWIAHPDYDDYWKKINVEELPRFLNLVKEASLRYDGSAMRTMLRNDAYWFSRLGVYIDRADNTARVLDVKYHVLLPQDAAVGGGIDYYQWAAILRSVSALVSYQWVYHQNLRPWLVADLLILREEMPRSAA